VFRLREEKRLLLWEKKKGDGGLKGKDNRGFFTLGRGNHSSRSLSYPGTKGKKDDVDGAEDKRTGARRQSL